MSPTIFCKKYPGVAAYGRTIRRVARRFDIQVQVYPFNDYPLLHVVYGGRHEFYVDVGFHRITCKRRCEYNARVYLGLNIHDMC